MTKDEVFYWIERHRSQIKIFLTPTIILMILGVYALVYATGGIKYVFSHSMYLPIAIAAIVFGAKGGVAAALAGGLLLGPFMPIDTLTGEQQDTINWLYRIGFFTLIGFVVGITSDLVFTYLGRMKWNSTHDSMTGLPNSYALAATIRNMSRSAVNKDRPGVLVVALWDNHTEIETSFGPQCVNEMIAQLADAIRHEIPDSTPVYRVATERLGFVLHGDDDRNIEELSSRLGEIFTVPLEFEDLRLHANVYLGAVTLDSGPAAKDPERYIQRAGRAATEASKDRARDTSLASVDDDSRTAENLKLLGELGQALTGDQIGMHYQPKVITATGVIAGVEALMRWRHPVLGAVLPSQFIPYAENSTLIDQITFFAIDRSLAQLVAWEERGMANMRMAVNISTKNLSNPDFARSVIQLLELHGVPGERLELEITESSFMDDMEGSIAELTSLTRVGIILSIDDFGTGYSSLQYLETMPASTIKIDQRFIRSLPDESGSRQIVEAAIGLAHSLGMTVVAEGVENQAAYDFLMSAGCNLAQGYFVGRPVPANQLEQAYRASMGRLVPASKAGK